MKNGSYQAQRKKLHRLLFLDSFFRFEVIEINLILTQMNQFRQSDNVKCIEKWARIPRPIGLVRDFPSLSIKGTNWSDRSGDPCSGQYVWLSTGGYQSSSWTEISHKNHKSLLIIYFIYILFGAGIITKRFLDLNTIFSKRNR